MSDATVGGLGQSTAVTGVLKLKGGTGATAFTFNSSASDATVGDLINDINTNGNGLIASLDSSGNLSVTDVPRTVALTQPAKVAGQHQHAEGRRRQQCGDRNRGAHQLVQQG